MNQIVIAGVLFVLLFISCKKDEQKIDILPKSWVEGTWVTNKPNTYGYAAYYESDGTFYTSTNNAANNRDDDKTKSNNEWIVDTIQFNRNSGFIKAIGKYVYRTDFSYSIDTIGKRIDFVFKAGQILEGGDSFITYKIMPDGKIQFTRRHIFWPGNAIVQNGYYEITQKLRKL